MKTLKQEGEGRGILIIKFFFYLSPLLLYSGNHAYGILSRFKETGQGALGKYFACEMQGKNLTLPFFFLISSVLK